ncbi:MAG TPA: cytochrome c, partial [Pirellulaceae bacterium]|nr:cytochrome c [Pirellulaceae bacterium]
GMAHYRAMCLQCHGAPDVKSHAFAKGLNPPPPALAHVAREWSDGELFWITKHGIRMTGMPAFGHNHSDEELWKIVAFLRQLDDLSEEQVAMLREGEEAGHDHGDHEHAGGHDHELVTGHEKASGEQPEAEGEERVAEKPDPETQER